MGGIFEKLNLKDQQEILVLRAPESFQPELARLPVLTIHHHIESVAEIASCWRLSHERAKWTRWPER